MPRQPRFWFHSQRSLKPLGCTHQGSNSRPATGQPWQCIRNHKISDPTPLSTAQYGVQQTEPQPRIRRATLIVVLATWIKNTFTVATERFKLLLVNNSTFFPRIYGVTYHQERRKVRPAKLRRWSGMRCNLAWIRWSNSSSIHDVLYYVLETETLYYQWSTWREFHLNFHLLAFSAIK